MNSFKTYTELIINFTPLFELNLVQQIKRYELLEQIIKSELGKKLHIIQMMNLNFRFIIPKEKVKLLVK